MKLLLYFLLIFILLTGSNCKKSSTTEDQLPPETTTGAMTFGCKIDGKVFVPKDGNGKPGLYVQYVYDGTGPGGGWYLNIPATNWETNPTQGFNIGTDSLLIRQDSSYAFKLDPNYNTLKGTFYAKYHSQSDGFLKTINDSGEIFIKKFDYVTRIISGTFSFSATSPSSGSKVNITEGRFDIHY